MAGLLAHQPAVLCQLFLQSMTSPDEMVRTLVFVHFRRLAHYVNEPKLSMWPRCDPSLHAQAKQALLECLVNETAMSVRRKVVDCIATLTKYLIGRFPCLFIFVSHTLFYIHKKKKKKKTGCSGCA